MMGHMSFSQKGIGCLSQRQPTKNRHTLKVNLHSVHLSNRVKGKEDCALTKIDLHSVSALTLSNYPLVLYNYEGRFGILGYGIFTKHQRHFLYGHWSFVATDNNTVDGIYISWWDTMTLGSLANDNRAPPPHGFVV